MFKAYWYIIDTEQVSLEQWYSTWGTRRHLRGYVKLEKNYFMITH
jgi:hypothetical protein